MNKDTIYIDIDDEITSIIEKVRSSNQKIVALVLPKRATMLQSIVNMKLLKRSAQEAKKSLVLITSETGLMPLAGVVGMHVAKSLQSKPFVPAGPETVSGADEVADVSEAQQPADDAAEEPDIDPRRSVGELSGKIKNRDNIKKDKLATDKQAAVSDEPDEIQLDDTDEETVPEALADATDTEEAEDDKPKKTKVPSFEKFRLRLILACVILLLIIGGGVFAAMSLPEAKISIKTNTTTFRTDITAQVTTAVSKLDIDKGIVPAKLEQTKKTADQKVSATGKKNEGTQASGAVTMSVKDCTIPIEQPANVGAGTGVSADGKTYITQQDTVFSSFATTTSDGCMIFQATSQTPVVAIKSGDEFNLGARNDYQVAGRPEVTAADENGMTGGTNKFVTVVSQKDIDDAKDKLHSQSQSGALFQLQNILKQDGYYPLDATLSTSDPTYTTSANAGDEASEVTVTATTTYTLMGVKKDDLVALIDGKAKTNMDAKYQKILDNGLDGAEFKVADKQSSTDMTLTTQAKVVVGPELDTKKITQEVIGKKRGQITDMLESRPGVKQVSVELSPFWVHTVPSNTDRVTVTLDTPKADGDK